MLKSVLLAMVTDWVLLNRNVPLTSTRGDGVPASENELRLTSRIGAMEEPLSTVRTLNSVFGPVPVTVALAFPLNVVLQIWPPITAISNTPLFTMLPWRINSLVTTVPDVDKVNCPAEFTVRSPRTSTVCGVTFSNRSTPDAIVRLPATVSVREAVELSRTNPEALPSTVTLP